MAVNGPEVEAFLAARSAPAAGDGPGCVSGELDHAGRLPVDRCRDLRRSRKAGRTGKQGCMQSKHVRLDTYCWSPARLLIARPSAACVLKAA